MFFFLAGFSLLVALVGVGLAVFSEYSKRLGGILLAGGLVLLLAVSFLFSATTVDARSVGIQTAFGKYQGTLSSGFHLTAPWANVEQFSTQVQYLNVDDVPVSYAGGGGGKVSATIRWTIDAENANKLWQRYRTFDNVRDQLVLSSARDAIRVSVSPYSPVDAKDGNNIPTINSNIQNKLSDSIRNDGVKLDSVSITNVALDERAQASLDKVVEATGNIDRAKAEQQRARIDNETAQLRQQTLTPEANLRYCLELVNNWNVQKNGPLPATFNCGLGGSTPVIVGNN